MPGETDIELQLLRLAQHDEHAAQKAVYTTYVRYLAAVCSRYVADDEDVKDVLQESFLRIFSAMRSFEYRGRGSLKGWITKIVVNESLKFMQRNSRVEFIGIDDTEPECADEAAAVDDVPPDILFRAIRQLPEGYRTIFNLYVIEEKSHKEIAALLGIKESTSASQLHRAKAMLASKIRQYNDSKKTGNE